MSENTNDVPESIMEAAITELESMAYLNGKKEVQSYEVDEAKSHLRKLIRKVRGGSKKRTKDSAGNDQLWKMKCGTHIEVGEMSEEHVRNSLRLVIENINSGRLRFTTLEERTGCDGNEGDIY